MDSRGALRDPGIDSSRRNLDAPPSIMFGLCAQSLCRSPPRGSSTLFAASVLLESVAVHFSIALLALAMPVLVLSQRRAKLKALSDSRGPAQWHGAGPSDLVRVIWSE